MTGAVSNKVRIIGGRWRSRVLRFAARPGLRPSPDRVRETLFNWLGQDLAGLRCLDLFAGSGALGFEAASRGAAHVVLVDRDGTVHASLLDNARRLGGNLCEVVRSDALQFLRSDTRTYDVIFLDPPFDTALAADAMPMLVARLNSGGRVYVESDRAHAFVAPAGWRVMRAATAGAVHYQLLERADDEP